MDLRKFVTAGTKKCRRCPLQQLDIHIRMNLRGKIHVLLIQKSLDAVDHAIDMFDFFAAVKAFADHPVKAAVDNGGWSAGLSYN